MPQFHHMPTDIARAYQDGRPDVYGHKPERAISTGVGTPCRHCLCNVPKGAEMLIFAYRPFEHLHPYAETGPVFLCADKCEPARPDKVPPILTTSPDYLVKGYTADERIAYGTGAIIPADEVVDRLETLLAQDGIAFADIRSARNNCWLARARA